MAKHADYNMNHKEDWFQAIKTDKRPCLDIEIGHRVATLNNLGNLSYILGRTLAWDGREERFVGDDDANRYLSRPQRQPYTLSAFVYVWLCRGAIPKSAFDQPNGDAYDPMAKLIP